MRSCRRPRVLVPALLAVALVECTAPAFGKRLNTNGRCMVSEGAPVEFRRRRSGHSLEALSPNADPRTLALALHRIQP